MYIQSPYFHILKLKSSPILDVIGEMWKERCKVLFLLPFKWLSNIVSFLSLLSLWTFFAKRIINFLLHYLTDIGKVRISENSFHFSTRDRGSVKQKHDKFEADFLLAWLLSSWPISFHYAHLVQVESDCVYHHLKDGHYNIFQTPLYAFGPRGFQTP